MDETYDSILMKLRTHIAQMDSLDDWIFVAINTMKAIVDNSCKEDTGFVLSAAEYSDTVQVQQLYDTVQGKYGREGFSYRNNPSYYYLSSLVARFPQTELSDADLDKIKECFEYEKFFLYEL